MKFPFLLIVSFLLAVDGSAQPTPNVSNPPDVVVTKKSWRKEIRNPALDVDPFRANDEQAEFERTQKDNAVRNAVRVREGGTPQPTVRGTRPVETESDGPSARYVYRATVKNTGTKTIVALAWDYRFLNPDTWEEIGRRSFLQRIKIRPGKSGELIGASVNPPTLVIDAAKAEKGQAKLSEQVDINRIEYADGSVWQRPPN